jgi:hypothetical protein
MMPGQNRIGPMPIRGVGPFFAHRHDMLHARHALVKYRTDRRAIGSMIREYRLMSEDCSGQVALQAHL